MIFPKLDASGYEGDDEMLILGGVASGTPPTNSQKPWIHVRSQWMARLRIGLAVFTAKQEDTTPKKQPQFFLDKAVGV